MAKGKCLIDDNLNTKVSPFFDTPFPSSYWLMGTKSMSSINTLINPSPKIYLRSIYPRTGYAKITSTRYDPTSSSRITLDPLELPIICISYIYQFNLVFQLDGVLRTSPVPPATFPPMNRFKYNSESWFWDTVTLSLDLLVPIPSQRIYKIKWDFNRRRGPIKCI